MIGTYSPSVCKLKHLSSLAIADWKGISGDIPLCLVTLPFLSVLYLIENRLTGHLPSDTGRLHRLTVLNSLTIKLQVGFLARSRISPD
ncbi:DNA damage-repair/toleration protein DRT100 [Linum perenne]